MKHLISKIGSLVDTIAKEKGELSFLGLALREEASVWDLLVAAEWIDQDRDEALKYLVHQVQRVLTRQELLKISAIIMLRYEYFTEGSSVKSELGWEESDIDLYGVAVQKAYLFVAPDVEFRMGPVHADKWFTARTIHSLSSANLVRLEPRRTCLLQSA